MLAYLHLGILPLHPPTVGHLAQPVLLGLAGSWIALLFHELGHTVAALLVGVRIWGIRLGVGPPVWRGTIGDCRVNLALFPFLGAVHLVDEDACAIGYRDIIAGSGMSEIAEPPLNDLWTVPGEEHLLMEFQTVDRAHFREIKATEHYHALQSADFELQKAKIGLLRATGELEAWVGVK